MASLPLLGANQVLFVSGSRSPLSRPCAGGNNDRHHFDVVPKLLPGIRLLNLGMLLGFPVCVGQRHSIVEFRLAHDLHE